MILTADRTIASPARERTKGVAPGNTTNLAEAAARGAEANRAAANAFAAHVLPIVLQIEADGAITPRAIAAALNARGIRTARGGAWHGSTVRNLLSRYALLSASTGTVRARFNGTGISPPA